MKVRIGYGYDVHELVEGEDFVLGGVKLDYAKGAFGHSDADVLIHVICDAILGAANMRDIGFHFPDTNQEYKGVDSKILLEQVMRIIRHKGFELGNIDSTICLQKPKINPYIPEMQQVLADCMQVQQEQISIKATTTEKLGFVGREEGVSAHAVVLLIKA
ncbi:MAG: 2-C-methyl-D-erythritol 2,4-cyclodiphosphate synthase [Flavobacteriales bacterium]|nr:2-C-methyl-D-erythritol 2,4-cyclodiphosphate synthase [Flavobacteriales bacterium]